MIDRLDTDAPSRLYHDTLPVLSPALREAVLRQQNEPPHPDRFPRNADGTPNHPLLLPDLVSAKEADLLTTFGQGLYAIAGDTDPGNRWLVDLHGKNAPATDRGRFIFQRLAKCLDQIARITKRTPFKRYGIQRCGNAYEEPPSSRPGLAWMVLLSEAHGGGTLLFPKVKLALHLRKGHVLIYSRDDSPAIVPVETTMFLARSHRPKKELARTVPGVQSNPPHLPGSRAFAKPLEHQALGAHPLGYRAYPSGTT